MTEPLVETEGVTYAYNSLQSRPSLDDVSITIGNGSKTAILGANGAGKSTLFYHLNGVLKPKKGTVLYKGQPLDYSPDALAELRSEMSVVVQNPDEQIFSATVEEDVAFGPMNMGMGREATECRIVESLEKVGMLDYRKRPTVQLSYGQRKRVAIAGALASEPKVLILDEPTAGLDPQMSLEVMELADQLNADGTTVVLSTHDVDLAYSWAEGIHVLSEGRLAYSGDPDGFFSDRRMTFASGLALPHAFSMACTALPCTDSGRPYPRTMCQLMCALMPPGTPSGRVFICAVDPDGPVPEPDCSLRTGIYGFSTRKMFSKNQLKTDFYFNAVDLCCTEALNGRDSVLYCDRNLAETAKARIEGLRRFGSRAEAVL